MESATAKSGNRGYRLVRIAVAVLLLTASALKCWQLATEPIAGTGLLNSRWLLMATVEFELLFGFWLLANLWAKPTWAAALACFGLFTCVSVCKAVSGHATCGCFGRVPVNPWYTSTLDLAVVLSLLRWRPIESSFAARHAMIVSMMWLLIGVPAAFAMGSYTDTTISDAGEIIGDGKIVVLQPESWMGKKFPLLSHIDIGSKLSSGLWLVLLHRHDCLACLEAAAQYDLLAKDFLARTNCPAIALIECPPYAQNASAAAATSLVSGRMDDGHEWQLTGPTCVLVDAGQVRSVFTNTRDIELLRAIWGNSEH
jgi:hypothetical protein